MIWTIVRIKLQDITVNSCIRLSIQRSFVFASSTPTPIVLDIWRVDNNRGEQVLSFHVQKWIWKQGRPTGPKFTFHAYPVHDQDLCAKWTKANPRKDCMCHVPYVELCTVYTCSSYYRRWIRTSLSSLQSHVLTSLWSNSYTIREDGWNGARFQTTSTSLVRNNQLPICFRAVLLSIRSLTMWEGHESGRCTFVLLTSWVRVWIATSMHENIGSFLFLTIDVNFTWNL